MKLKFFSLGSRSLEAFVVSLAVLLAACRSDSTHPASGTEVAVGSELSPASGYVPDEACQACHADLYASYQEVGMARSFYPPEPQNLIEDFENSHYYHAASGQHFEMKIRDGAIYQQRYQLDETGRRINELEVQVDAIIGSGNHVRCYVYRTPSGEMFQMPLAWYSQEQKWRLNPGYDNPEHEGFQRKITRECMFCHNAFPETQPGTDAYWQPQLFPQKLPHGIGCQRCHGPGEQHVELALSSSSTMEAIRAAVINPTALEPKLRDDVCYQCHLQPSSQILSELVRVGRGEYSFRPGESLNDFRALLDYHIPGDEERFEINHHPYRMRQSKCYIESSGALSCLSCHDPHRRVPESQRVAHYQQACLRCHQPADCQTAAHQFAHGLDLSATTVNSEAASGSGVSGVSDCVGCHMPERRAHDAIHATMTDHKIVAQPEPARERLAPRSELPPERRAVNPFPYWPADAAAKDGRGMEIYQAIAGSQAGNDRHLRDLIELVQETRTTDVQPLAELALALRNRGAVEEELDILLRLVQHHPDHVQANLELAMALAAVGQHERALNHYQRALSIGPPLPETHLGIGVSMLHRQDMTQAITHFREAVALRPLYPEALLNLGIALHATRQWNEAREMLRRALAADPSFVEAHAYLESIPAKL